LTWDDLKAASLVCGFFFVSAAWYLVAPAVLYLIYVPLLPLIEETVKVASYRLVRWRSQNALSIVMLFIALESLFKFQFAPKSFYMPGLNQGLSYLIVLSPAALHVFNLAVAQVLRSRGNGSGRIIAACAAVHFAYNVYRNLMPPEWYFMFLLDTILLSIVSAHLWITVVRSAD
jgi:hypothetical protein